MPEEFSPFKGAYIHYLISRLEWNPSYVMFGAKAKFSATIEGKNITFNPAVSIGTDNFSLAHCQWLNKEINRSKRKM